MRSAMRSSTLLGRRSRPQAHQLSEDYTVIDWARSSGATEEEVRKAVAEVGQDVATVGEYLGKK